MPLKNRHPSPSFKIPRAIREEYNFLMWCKRAQEELSEMDSVRATSLIQSIGALTCTPSVQAVADQGPSSNDTHTGSHDLPLETIDLSSSRVPLYNQFVVPECIVNVISNLKVWEAVVIISILAAILLVV